MVRRPVLTRWTARVLIVVGAAIIVWCVIERAHADTYQQRHGQALRNAGRGSPEGRSTPAARPEPGEPIGVLEISRLRLSAVVVHGETDAILKTAVGHLVDTPFPWDGGNTALAAHRDTFFRPLEHVHHDDLLRLKTARGEYHYRVRETLVVDPEDVWVLDPTPTPTLTLITCYPFRYVGSAPQRFIVRAERVDASSTAT